MNNDTSEILLILQEECAEVTQAISKCFRFGSNQIKPGKNRTNIDMLQEELGDLLAMVDLLVWQDIGIGWDSLNKAKKQKIEKLKQWSNLKL